MTTLSVVLLATKVLAEKRQPKRNNELIRPWNSVDSPSFFPYYDQLTPAEQKDRMTQAEPMWGSELSNPEKGELFEDLVKRI